MAGRGVQGLLGGEGLGWRQGRDALATGVGAGRVQGAGDSAGRGGGVPVWMVVGRGGSEARPGRERGLQGPRFVGENGGRSRSVS
jgi:hypothetical protein